MHRPFTRRQALENARFLKALRRTGNPRLAAELLGVHRSTYTKRRAKCPAFATAWDAELAAAHADFHAAGGETGPPSVRPERSRGAPHHPQPLRTKGGPALRKSALRTEGGELVVGRTRNGRLQLRRAPKGWMTKAGEQAFFAALSATANVRLAAAAAGFTHSAFYQKQAKRRHFAREMRLALAMGYERVKAALHAAGLVGSHQDDAWRHNAPPPIPPMTVNQAIQLLYLHEKTVGQGWDKPHRRRRRNESEATYRERLRAMWTADKAREAEDEALRVAGLEGRWDDWTLGDKPWLPALEQVQAALEQRAQRSERDGADRPTGPRSGTRSTSRHNGALTEPEPDRAMFGGWRLKDWQQRRKRGK